MNQSDLEKLARKFPISEATRRRNQAGPVGPPAADPKPVEGLPLERVHKRKEKGGIRVQRGVAPIIPHRIHVSCYAVRPADSDAYHVKEIIDCITRSGLLVDDSWKHVESVTVASKKVHSKVEEKTVVEIIPVTG